MSIKDRIKKGVFYELAKEALALEARAKELEEENAELREAKKVKKSIRPSMDITP